MSVQIDKDSYLIIVYNDFDKIIVSDFKVKEVEETKAALNDISSNTGTNTGQKVMKLLTAGLTSSIAKNISSKINLPSSIKGRIQSSIYDIISDGKISKEEIAKDFINSCTNELDSVAIAMGFPTSQTLYQALAPDGAGVIATDFLKHFEKKLEEKQAETISKKNKVAQDLTTLKFKLVPSDSETWSSNLPTRKTEKGFNIVDSIENENKQRDFSISIIQGDYSGVTNMYDVKKTIEDIWIKKIPFDIYVNDIVNKNTEILKRYFFNSISWETEGINCLNANISVSEIPEWEIKIKTIAKPININSRNQKPSKSSRLNATKTKEKQKKSSVKLNAGTPLAQENLKGIQSQVDKDKAYLKKNAGADGYYVDKWGRLKEETINAEFRATGLNGTAKDRIK